MSTQPYSIRILYIICTHYNINLLENFGEHVAQLHRILRRCNLQQGGQEIVLGEVFCGQEPPERSPCFILYGKFGRNGIKDLFNMFRQFEGVPDPHSEIKFADGQHFRLKNKKKFSKEQKKSFLIKQIKL